MGEFIHHMGLDKFALFVFDYGAPVGLRLACAHPDKITGFVSQNGNAYLEGLGDAWDPIKKYWQEPTQEHRQTVKDAILHLEGTRWQYEHGVDSPESIAPETYYLDCALFERLGNKDIQLDLFLDYANNLKMYPDFQAFFRQTQLPSLIIWGKNDPFFIPAGAHAYQRDNPNAVIELLDSGHFALETHVGYIAKRIREVLT